MARTYYYQADYNEEPCLMNEEVVKSDAYEMYLNDLKFAEYEILDNEDGTFSLGVDAENCEFEVEFNDRSLFEGEFNNQCVISNVKNGYEILKAIAAVEDYYDEETYFRIADNM